MLFLPLLLLGAPQLLVVVVVVLFLLLLLLGVAPAQVHLVPAGPNNGGGAGSNPHVALVSVGPGQHGPGGSVGISNAR